MYGQQPTNQQYLVNKKKHQIDDQSHISKKAQKNKWKKQKKFLKQQQDIQQILEHKSTQKNNPTSTQQQNRTKWITQSQKHEQMVDDIMKIIGYPQKLVREKLKQANYNKEVAMNLILNKMEPCEEDMSNELFDKDQNNNNRSSNNNCPNNNNKKKASTNNNKKQPLSQQPNKVQQQAYKLLNQIYQKSQMQISGFQFEQLFNQITQIIKQDQKQKGKGLIEINNLVQTCMTVKDTILVGLKDVFKLQTQIDFDQNDPVNIQLQQFIYQDTQKQVQQQVINKEQFPTLGQPSNKKGNKNNNTNTNKTNNQYKKPLSPPKSSIINKLQNENKHFSGPIKKQDLFKPSNHKPVQFIQKNSIFNIDNCQQSQDALRDLHKEYNHVPINKLKIAYVTLDKNFHQCRLFLDRYYPKDKAQIKRVQNVQSFSSREKRLQPHRVFLNPFRRQSIQEIDKQLQRWSLNQLRAEIQHLYGLRQVFHMTCKNIMNANQRKQLMRIAEERAPQTLIQKLSKASRVKLTEQTMRSNPLYVDLHGYREEQVSMILKGMIAALRQQFDMGNERVKYRTFGGRTQAIMQIMTGKGRHSQYGKSILKPCVKQWCEQHDLRAIVNDDNVEIFIPLN